MSFRSNHTVQTKVQKQILSYRQVHGRNQQSFSSSSSSSSRSQSPISLQKKDYNFNSGYNLKPAQVSSDSKSQYSSENQTENFIRAQFKPSLHNQPQDFKLFNKSTSKFIKQQKETQITKINDNFSNENRKRKETYDTAYFQISIEDQSSNQATKRYKIPQINNFPTKSLPPNHQIIQPPKYHNKEANNNNCKFHLFSELQALEEAIMKTLKQKQKHIQLLIKQVHNLNEQKIYNFKTNSQLQRQLETLQDKRKQQNLTESNKNNWRPKTVEQMKLQLENQHLTDELRKLQDEQSRLKQVQRQSKEQEKIMRQSLKSTLKTRKQYTKNLIPSNHHDINHQTDNKKRVTSTTGNDYFKGAKPKIKKNHHQVNYQMRQKQLLIKLLNDFNELKEKVDQSLVNQQKQRSIFSKKKQTGKKKMKNAANLKR